MEKWKLERVEERNGERNVSGGREGWVRVMRGKDWREVKAV